MLLTLPSGIYTDAMTKNDTDTKTFKYIDFIYIYSCGWLEKKTLYSYKGMILHSRIPKLNSNLIQNYYNK